MSAGWTKVLPRMFSIFVVILSVSCGESRNKYGSRIHCAVMQIGSQ